MDQDDGGGHLHFQNAGGAPLQPVRADVVVACDGVNSAVRRQFYPDEKLAFGGINTWRGVTVRPPILSGKSYLRIGSIDTGKMVIYPIADNVDGKGSQLVNWVAEIRREGAPMNDWNQPGRPAGLPRHLQGLALRLARRAGADHGRRRASSSTPWWTRTRCRAGRSAASRCWATRRIRCIRAAPTARPRPSSTRACWREQLATAADGPAALAAYEGLRLAPTARIVETNRTVPPDFINIKVDELSGGKPFRHIDDLISQDELRRMSDEYKRIAGFSLDAAATA